MDGCVYRWIHFQTSPPPLSLRVCVCVCVFYDNVPVGVSCTTNVACICPVQKDPRNRASTPQV